MFTADNTEGYSAADLAALNAALNAAFEAVCQAGDLPTSSAELSTGSLLDHISETLLKGYDNGLRGEALVIYAGQH